MVGRPKGTKRTTTLGGIERAEKLNNALYQFIKKYIAADPKQYGSKSRAYSAASAKFGASKGLARTTIDRRTETLRKAEQVTAKVLSQLHQFNTDQGPLLKRMHAAFTADEWAEISELSQPLLLRLLKDREAALKLAANK